MQEFHRRVWRLAGMFGRTVRNVGGMKKWTIFTVKRIRRCRENGLNIFAFAVEWLSLKHSPTNTKKIPEAYCCVQILWPLCSWIDRLLSETVVADVEGCRCARWVNAVLLSFFYWKNCCPLCRRVIAVFEWRIEVTHNIFVRWNVEA